MLQYFPNITGSLQVTGSVSVSGSITATGGIIVSGSIASASYSSNSELLDNLDSTAFVFTSSYNPASSSFSSRVTTIESKYATTGSNIFTGAQTVCANITSTGTIIAQTLNVQQVTSSVVYSSGSNVFGCSLSNTQQFTGSVFVTGSTLNVNGGAICATQNMCIGGMGIVASCLGIGTSSPSQLLHLNVASGTVYSRIQNNNNSLYLGLESGGIAQVSSDVSSLKVMAASYTSFETCGAERMRITSTGIACFSCQVCASTSITVSSLSNTLNCIFVSRYSTDDNYRLLQNQYVCSGLVRHSFDLVNAGTVYACTLVFDRGNVGIGTASPSFKLHVVGCNFDQLLLDNTGQRYTALDFRNNGVTKTDLYYDDTCTAFNIRTRVSGPLILSTNDTERMRITSGGIVQINTICSIGGGVLNLNGDLRFGGIAAQNYCIINYQGGSLNLGSNNSIIMGIGPGGEVAIGSSERQYYTALNVRRASDIALSGTTYRVARFTSTAACYSDLPGIYLGFGSDGAGVIAASTEGTGNPLAFLTYNGSWSERLRITATGIACFACQVCAPLFISPNWRGKSYAQTSSSGGTSIIDTCINAASYGAGNIYSVAWGGNPNAAGASYFSSKFGYIGVITGYNGNVVKIISYTQIANFENVGTLCLFPFFFDGTTECTTVCADYTGCIRIKICGYNASYPAVGQEVYITRLLG